MPPKLTEALARYAEAVGTTVGEAEDELAAVVNELAEAASAGAIPGWDAQRLRCIDTPWAAASLAVVDARLGGDAAWSRMRSTAVSIEDAARRLEVSTSAVRRVIGERPSPQVELLGVKDRRTRWRVFTYQLPDPDGHGGEPSTRPGRRVQRALPVGMHPLAVACWWDAPNPGLHLDGVELSPRRWVALGLNPGQLMRAAAFEDAM